MNRFAIVCVCVAFTVAQGISSLFAAQPVDRPNVVLVITDDQGYGDIAAHGNTMIKTPHLDELFKQSVRLTDYHVDPTCSPTRSALMSGRYSTRTGVWHTIMGRSMMSADEWTIAELLKSAGYATGCFGKWHLGDNYPCRPQDQGFDEVLIHGGGGVGQTPDYFGNDYFDDTYFRNGQPEKHEGYCTDVWFRESLRFIEKNKDGPFFVYLTTNAPHGPFLVAEKYSKPYRDQGVPATMAAFYGMITNIDENMGRLTEKLAEWGLAENTILIFTTDNGTAAGVARARKGKRGAEPAEEAWLGFNAGMRGQKGSEYDGGHRVPLYVRWPKGGIGGGRDVDHIAAHIDVLPTLAELCGATVPAGVELDGKSLAPLLKGDAGDWPERTLLVHSQRIEYPQKWRKSAVMTDQWRLINGKELYDIVADPGQQKNVAKDHADIVAELTKQYEAWWQSLSVVFDDYVDVAIGSDAENPARLTCHDWHTSQVPWNQGHIRSGPHVSGFWAVSIVEDGKYEFTLRRWPEEQPGPLDATLARLQIGDQNVTEKTDVDAECVTFQLDLPKGRTRLQTWLTNESGETPKTRGAYFVYVRRLP
jgi:arylsulfatase A-like enzyme